MKMPSGKTSNDLPYMNIEEICKYCILFPGTVECFPFDLDTLVMKTGGKIWAVVPLEKPGIIIVKCDPELAIELRERYQGINPAWHFNKKHWNQIDTTGSVPQHIIKQSLAHSYSLIVSSLPRKIRTQLNITAQNVTTILYP